jgi:hypothetical protein
MPSSNVVGRDEHSAHLDPGIPTQLVETSPVKMSATLVSLVPSSGLVLSSFETSTMLVSISPGHSLSRDEHNARLVSSGSSLHSPPPRLSVHSSSGHPACL